MDTPILLPNASLCISRLSTVHADTEANLIAPIGFERYRWTNSSGTLLDTLQKLKVAVPDQNSTYNCTMTSATGCVVSLHSTVLKYIPHADFGSLMLDCNSNTVQFLNNSTTNHGALQYNWYFENENTSVFKRASIHLQHFRHAPGDFDPSQSSIGML